MYNKHLFVFPRVADYMFQDFKTARQGLENNLSGVFCIVVEIHRIYWPAKGNGIKKENNKDDRKVFILLSYLLGSRG